MPNINIKLFNTPYITIDDVPVHIPYKKAEALFYYMAIEKKASREFVTELLWEDNDEALAKKNLRHALYTINKLFDEPIILSPQKSTLSFSENSENIHNDYDDFISDPSAIQSEVKLLDGFYLKNTPLFEEWLDRKQSEVNNLFSRRLTSLLFNYDTDRGIEETERIANLCIKEDPLDERTYKYLMEYYRKHKLFHKAINLYQTLINVLKEELGISPGKEISALYHELLDEWLANSSDDDNIDTPDIQIRKSKLTYLINCYDEFLKGHVENILVTGENGIGKTYLVNSFINSIDLSNVLLIDVTCFQSERKYLLQIWNNIFLKLEDYIKEHNIDIPMNYLSTVEGLFPMFGNPGSSYTGNLPAEFYNNRISFRSCQNALLKIFQLISHQTKILLYIDNINAMDSISLELLSALLQLKNDNIMVVLTSLDTMSYDLTTFVSSMLRAKYLTNIVLEPLTLEQTEYFIHDSLPDVTLNEDDIKSIYEQSNGNIFFLKEIINNLRTNHDSHRLSLNAQEILNDRLNGVTPETRKLLDVIALFEDRVPCAVLMNLYKDSTSLPDSIEEAKELALIKEFKDYGEVYFSFSYHQMRDFIYNKISSAKLHILNNRAALAIEEYINNSLYSHYSYKMLAEYFDKGQNHKKALYYRLLYFEKLSLMYFELYPILDSSIIDEADIEIPADISSEFNKLMQELSMIRNHENDDLYNEMSARLYLAKSRYYVLVCEYGEAVKCIDKALSNPYTEKNPVFHVNLLKQKIYYCMQTCDMEDMKINLDLGMELIKKEDIIVEESIYMRLYGYYYMVTGEFDTASEYLNKSIDFLKKSTLDSEIYAVNIAAAYNYLGEINLRNGKLSEAHSYFEMSIQLCADKGYTVNATFYTNLGKVLFFEKKYEESRKAFIDAHNVYRCTTAIVGCGTMHAFLAYYNALDNNLEHASHHIRVCRRMIDRINSPYEAAMLNFVLYLLSEKNNPDFKFITHKPEYYKKVCIDNLKVLNDPYLLSFLK